MKFNTGTSVLLGNVLGQFDDQKESANSKQFYNNWNERQERFASQYNSASQLIQQFPKQNPTISLIPNHNNNILSKRDLAKGMNASLLNQSSTGGSILDYHAQKKKQENYYQIPTTTTVSECKICAINNSVCSICLQKQNKNSRQFLNPKGSESFSTNVPLYKQYRMVEQDKLNTSLPNNSYRESIKQLSLPKKIEQKKQQMGIEYLTRNSAQYLQSAKQNEGLRLKLNKPTSNGKQETQLSQSLLGTLDHQKNSAGALDRIHPSTTGTGKKESGRRQYFSQHTSQTNGDEKILTDHYLNYILGIKKDEIQNGSYNLNQTLYQADKLYQIQSDSQQFIPLTDKSKFRNLFPLLQDNGGSSVTKQNSNQLSQHNIQMNQNDHQLSQSNINDYMSQVKVVDLNNLLSKQKSCSQYVNSQLVSEINQIKKNNLINITHINFGGRADLNQKKKLENEYYSKNISIENKPKSEPAQQQIQQNNPLLACIQTTQQIQKQLKKPKKNVIYSKIKNLTSQNSITLNTTIEGELSIQQERDSPKLHNRKEATLQTCASEEMIEQMNQKSEQKFKEYMHFITSNNNQEHKSNKKLLKTSLIDNEDILDEKSEVSDQVEEEYHNLQMAPGKKKTIAEQLQRYVRNLKNNVIQSQQNQQQQQKNDQNVINQSEKENKRLVAIEPSELKISSLAQKSSDQNIFNFKYRRNLQKAQPNVNVNTNITTQSIELNDQDSTNLVTTDSKDQQKFDNKLMNQESTTSLDALPITFPKLHRPVIKKNVSVNQRQDLQLNAQKINVVNRLDKQNSQTGKESFYEQQSSNKKQNEKQIVYLHSQTNKQNKNMSHQLSVSSNKHIKTEPSSNDQEYRYHKNGIQINSFINKNRISLKDIQLPCTNYDSSLASKAYKEETITINYRNHDDLSYQDIDLCEWKNSPVEMDEEDFLVEKTQHTFDEIKINKQYRYKKQKVFKFKNQLNTSTQQQTQHMQQHDQQKQQQYHQQQKSLISQEE